MTQAYRVPSVARPRVRLPGYRLSRSQARKLRLLAGLALLRWLLTPPPNEGQAGRSAW